jgi:hypothetical protein
VSERRRPSVIFSLLILVGMFITLVGLVMTLFGLGGSTTFDLSFDKAKVSTTSTGLAVMVIGAAMSAGVAMKLPANVEVFGPTETPFPARLKRLTPLFLVVAAVGVVGLVVSLVVSS